MKHNQLVKGDMVSLSPRFLESRSYTDPVGTIYRITNINGVRVGLEPFRNTKRRFQAMHHTNLVYKYTEVTFDALNAKHKHIATLLADRGRRLQSIYT